MSCSKRLAFGCWLLGNLLRMLAVLCTQHRCSRVLGHSSPIAFQNPSAPSATAVVGAFARAVGKAEQLLLALRRGADDNQDALRLVLQTRLQIDAVRPDVDV